MDLYVIAFKKSLLLPLGLDEKKKPKKKKKGGEKEWACLVGEQVPSLHAIGSYFAHELV